MTERQPWVFLWGVLPWIAWALAFGFLEWRGLAHPSDGLPPLTQVVRRYVPAWLVFGGIGWLLWHFTATFLSP